MTAVTPGGGFSTDVGMIITAAFPNGKPEMSAADFKKAYDIVKAYLAGGPRPGKTSLDYPMWAHCLMVEWKILCDKAKNAGKAEPNQLICPECGTAMVLDHSQSNVLKCVGGCNRAITMDTFCSLFRNVKPAKPAYWTPSASQSSGSLGGNVIPFMKKGVGAPGYVPPTQPVKPASISSFILPGQDPVAAGIVEKMPKSKKPLTSWRCWRVDSLEALPPRLKSVSFQEFWPPMEPIHAKCAGKDPDTLDHECPSWHHKCGVYSVKTLKDINRWASGRKPLYNLVSVVGEIEMWGRVLEYEDGFRSEFAYPLRLWVPESFDGMSYSSWATPQELADALWSTYLVEVNLSDKVVIDLEMP